MERTSKRNIVLSLFIAIIAFFCSALCLMMPSNNANADTLTPSSAQVGKWYKFTYDSSKTWKDDDEMTIVNKIQFTDFIWINQQTQESTITVGFKGIVISYPDSIMSLTVTFNEAKDLATYKGYTLKNGASFLFKFASNYNYESPNSLAGLYSNFITEVTTCPESGHLGLSDWIEEVAPTDTTVGTVGHYTCSVCGKNLDYNKNEINSLYIQKTATEGADNLSNSESGKTLTGGESAGSNKGGAVYDETLYRLSTGKDKYWTNTKYVYSASGNYLQFTHTGDYASNQGTGENGEALENEIYSEFRFDIPQNTYYISFDYFMALNQYKETGAQITRANIKVNTVGDYELAPYTIKGLMNDNLFIDSEKTRSGFTISNHNSKYPILIGTEWNNGFKTFPFKYTTNASIKWYHFGLVCENFGDMQKLIFNMTIDGSFGIKNLKVVDKATFLAENYSQATTNSTDFFDDMKTLDVQSIFELPVFSYTFKINLYGNVEENDALVLYFGATNTQPGVMIRFWNKKTSETQLVKFEENLHNPVTLLNSTQKINKGTHYIQLWTKVSNGENLIGLRIDDKIQVQTTITDTVASMFNIQNMSFVLNSGDEITDENNPVSALTLGEYENYLNRSTTEKAEDFVTDFIENTRVWFSDIFGTEFSTLATWFVLAGAVVINLTLTILIIVVIKKRR